MDSVERAILGHNLVIVPPPPAPTDFLLLICEHYIGNYSVKLDDYQIDSERLLYAFTPQLFIEFGRIHANTLPK